MTADYYSVLGIPKSSDEDSIKNAFRKLSLKYHPDKNKNKDAKKKFEEVAEAFHVLSNLQLRTIYDLHGELGLKNGIDGSQGGYQFHGNSHEVFSNFFGGNNPFQSYFNTVGGFGSKFGGMYALNLENSDNPHQATVSPPIERKIPITLDEFYNGAIKKLKITKNVLDQDGQKTHEEEKILSIKINKGWKSGMKICFPKEGDQAPNIIPSDVILVLDEVNHDIYKRIGNDLHYTANISLLEALSGFTLHLTTLDQRVLHLAFAEVVDPQSKKVIEHEGKKHSIHCKYPGMPIPNSSQFGNLIIHFNIKFPKYLTANQKALIRKAIE